MLNNKYSHFSSGWFVSLLSYVAPGEVRLLYPGKWDNHEKKTVRTNVTELTEIGNHKLKQQSVNSKRKWQSLLPVKKNDQWNCI
jgi:hypothetical protein